MNGRADRVDERELNLLLSIAEKKQHQVIDAEGLIALEVACYSKSEFDRRIAMLHVECCDGLKKLISPLLPSDRERRLNACRDLQRR